MVFLLVLQAKAGCKPDAPALVLCLCPFLHLHKSNFGKKWLFGYEFQGSQDWNLKYYTHSQGQREC